MKNLLKFIKIILIIIFFKQSANALILDGLSISYGVASIDMEHVSNDYDTTPDRCIVTFSDNYQGLRKNRPFFQIEQNIFRINKWFKQGFELVYVPFNNYCGALSFSKYDLYNYHFNQEEKDFVDSSRYWKLIDLTQGIIYQIGYKISFDLLNLSNRHLIISGGSGFGLRYVDLNTKIYIDPIVSETRFYDEVNFKYISSGLTMNITLYEFFGDNLKLSFGSTGLSKYLDDRRFTSLPGKFESNKNKLRFRVEPLSIQHLELFKFSYMF